MQTNLAVWQDWREATEALLFFSMEPQFAEIIVQADKAYRGEDDQDPHADQFESYLLYDYRVDGLSFADRYAAADRPYSEFFKAVAHNYFSGFEVMRHGAHVFLKDVFTKRDFKLLNPEVLEGESFLVGRAIGFADGYILAPDFELYTKETMEAFKRAILERHAAERQNEALESFIEHNALLMMRYLDILETIMEAEQSEEETYLVHQSTYLHQNSVKIREVLEASPNCEITLDEPEDLIFRLMHEGDIMAEIVLMKNKVVLECVEETALSQSRKWFEAQLGELIVHFADEVLTLDDLLES